MIDVGAHKGEFISKVVKLGTPLFVFEPQASVHGILKDVLKSHNVKAFFEAAVADRSGKTQLFINELSSTTSTVAPNEDAAWIKFKRTILGGHLIKEVREVEVVSLDDVLLGEFSKFHNGLLKIDVEGREGDVLKGAAKLLSSGMVSFVQIERARYEIYSDKNEVADPVSTLEKYGFEEKKRFLFPLLNFYDVVFERKSRKA